jgi:hypothetical protein
LNGQDAYTGRILPVASTYAKTHKPMSNEDAEGWSPQDHSPTITYWPRDRSDAGTDVAVVQPLAFIGVFQQSSMEGKGTVGFSQEDLAKPVKTQSDGQMVVQPLAFDARQSDTIIYGDRTGPLDTDGHTVGVCVTGDRTHALTTRSAAEEDGTGRGNPIVACVAPSLTAANDPSRSPQSDTVTYAAPKQSTSRTLTTGCGSDPSHHQGGTVIAVHTAVVQPVLSFKPGQSEAAGGIFITDEYAPTLQAINNGSTAVPAVVIDAERQVCPTLTSRMQGSSGWAPYNEDAHIIPQASMSVRRLTPTECERLQGFPDGWTQIAWKGKAASECPDGPRYRALGNSMAVNVMRWIGRRIELVEKT